MQFSSFNKLSIKEINRQNVYALLYHEPSQSKMQLARTLNMSLSTVDSNIKSLLQSNLITEAGSLESTGGRKAQSYCINALAHYAIGLFLLEKRVIATAVDLNGEPIWEETFYLDYDITAKHEYFSQLNNKLTELMQQHVSYTEQCLGFAFALQGTVGFTSLNPYLAEGLASVSSSYIQQSKVNKNLQLPSFVNYGILLTKNNQQVTLAEIQDHFALPCSIYHDAKAAAFSELWEHNPIDNAALFLLNHNLGGALIFHNMVHYGNQGRGGLIEHLKVGHENRQCYCGNPDCLECYCSQKALEKDSGLDTKTFFQYLHSPKNKKQYALLIDLWQKYLHYLAISIYNVSRLIDGKIILTGAIAPYIQPQDLNSIIEQVNTSVNTDNKFCLEPEDLLLSPRSDAVVALGAARYLINAYLEGFDANPIQDQCYHAANLHLNTKKPNT